MEKVACPFCGQLLPPGSFCPEDGQKVPELENQGIAKTAKFDNSLDIQVFEKTKRLDAPIVVEQNTGKTKRIDSPLDSQVFEKTKRFDTPFIKEQNTGKTEKLDSPPYLLEDVVPKTERIDPLLPFESVVAKTAKVEQKYWKEEKSFEGVQIGEYIAERKVGEGGMGEVWLGKHPVIGKQVAIKILSERLINNTKIVTRFRREASAVNQIQHNNLVDIFSLGQLPNGQPYMVMEYLKGKTLKEYLEEKKILSFSEILSILGQTCRAVSAAHDQGIIHRDLKPDNIFLIFDPSAPPFVKILDFGIAKLADNDGGPSLTRTGVPFGTPAYMSPEQCEGAKLADERSDVYSLGIILFEMITGRTPFYEPGDGVGKVWARHKLEAPPSPSSMVSGRNVPLEIDVFVLNALAKEPSDRPASCALFLKGLTHAAGVLQSEEQSDIKSAESIWLLKDKPQKMPTGILSAEMKTNDFEPVRTENHYNNDSVPDSVQTPPSQSFSNKLLIGLGATLSILLGVSVAYFLFFRNQPKTSYSEEKKPLPTTTKLVSLPVTTLPETLAASAPALEKTISINVISIPKGAQVYIDGEFLGETPLKNEILPYGEEEVVIRVEKEGFEPEEYPFIPDSSSLFDPELQKISSGTSFRPPKSNQETKNPPQHVLEEDIDQITVDPFKKKRKQ